MTSNGEEEGLLTRMTSKREEEEFRDERDPSRTDELVEVDETGNAQQQEDVDATGPGEDRSSDSSLSSLTQSSSNITDSCFSDEYLQEDLRVKKKKKSKMAQLLSLVNRLRRKKEPKWPTVIPALRASKRKHFSKAVEDAVADFVQTVTTAGVNGLMREFEEIRECKTTSSLSHEAFSANKKLNRHKWNVCLDATRVVLESRFPAIVPDYINANWVRPANVSTDFIVTQGPLRRTVLDFWLMCYQQKVTHILMLCNIVENGEAKCAKYWPAAENTQFHYGIYAVTNRKVFADDDCELALLELSISACSEPPRRIELVRLLRWFDAEAPPSKNVLMERLRCISSAKNRGPCVVVSSSGCGRPGTAIALQVITERLFKGIPVRMAEVVKELRGMRARSVENVGQYVYIAFATLQYIKMEMPGAYDDEFQSFHSAIMRKDLFASLNTEGSVDLG